ncbi:hypothetical protein F1C10_06400 [Sphingomonas sp. NBWT7]|uniref:hypothetical protein n=1 Tax=Sphingomonas sp. NBWT7 TaxID=2596913 RepID=UPI001626A58F|nr:hypothetical protein [Sphingomonas sp. NBWT7]QNE31596.1 hypothetical protein F1C10_06400 [Sphingomonas sp. NBWT7]
MKWLAALCGLGVTISAAAQVTRSPEPRGVYRLTPGIYVEQGTGCAAPPNASIRRYDGRGISGAHSRACRVTMLSRRGNRYSVSQSCIDAGAGPAPRSSERQVVTVRDATTFTLRRGASASTFRYCPIAQLPADLREYAR